MSEAQAPALEQDVPCAGCGYDLRGLTPPGRCPECGFDLGESVREYGTRSLDWLPPDPVWERRIREGAWLSVIAFALVLFAVVAPDMWYHLPYRNAPLSQTPGRVVFLGIACSWWALSWAAAWKLTTMEPASGGRRSWRIWGRAARVLCTAHFAIPFLWAMDPGEYKSQSLLVLLVTVLLGGLLGCFALLVRVGQLFRRRGATVATGEALVLSVVLGAAVFYRLGEGNNGPSSLSLMFELPVYPYGLPWVVERLWRPGLSDHYDLFALTYLGLPLWSVSLMLRLAWVYRPASLRPAIAAARA